MLDLRNSKDNWYRWETSFEHNSFKSSFRRNKIFGVSWKEVRFKSTLFDAVKLEQQYKKRKYGAKARMSERPDKPKRKA